MINMVLSAHCVQLLQGGYHHRDVPLEEGLLQRGVTSGLYISLYSSYGLTTGMTHVVALAMYVHGVKRMGQHRTCRDMDGNLFDQVPTCWV